jgi:hypothetical protein
MRMGLPISSTKISPACASEADWRISAAASGIVMKNRVPLL